MQAFPAPHSPPDPVVRTAFGIVAALSLANLAFNLICAARGLDFPFTNYLFRADDNFSDFFSLLAGYPGGAVARIADHRGLHALVPIDPPSQQTLRWAGGPLVTNLHMMPLPTIIDLLTIRLLRIVDPVACFLALTAALLAAWIGIAIRHARDRRDAALWIALGLVSYPMLLMVVRGNLFAGLCAIALIQALLLGLRRRSPIAAAALLALAVNIRPNAILFAAPLLLFYWPQRWRFAVTLGIVGMTLVSASLLAASALYPAYRFDSFLLGLKAYYLQYVTLGWGFQSGSSLYCALVMLYGAQPAFDRLALLVALALLGGGMVARLARRIDDALLIFLAATAYCLGSTILGDYHLVTFLVVPLALALLPGSHDGETAMLRRIVVIATALVLAPKNYIFVGPPGRPISIQALLNPIILLIAAVLILIAAAAQGRLLAPSRRPALA